MWSPLVGGDGGPSEIVDLLIFVVEGLAETFDFGPVHGEEHEVLLELGVDA